jgi:hypothetical protein
MKSPKPERFHPRIDRKLACIARTSPVPPAWHVAWSGLGPQSTGEHRLRVCQAVRDSGTLPEEAGYFLVSWAAEKLADDEVSRLSDPLRTLNVFESCRAFDRVFGGLLEGHGEAPMAALLRTDPDEHARRREAGRQFFFRADAEGREDTLGWLDNLLRAVAAAVVASRPVDGLAYRYRPNQFVRELHVRPPAGVPRPVEPAWAIDIERLREWFDRMDGCGWYAAPADPGESPYLWVEGKFEGREVFLRLLPNGAHAAEEDVGWEVWRKP